MIFLDCKWMNSRKALLAEMVFLVVLSYVYITVKMYPCSGGTDTGSPEL